MNRTGAGGVTAGDVYVVDSSNNRISEFSGSGAFVRAFGRNVISSGPDNNNTGEVQSVTVKATSGTFSLKFGGQTTGALAYNVPASGGVGATASVQNALEALSTIGSGNVAVAGGPGDATGSAPYVVTFTGTQAGKNVEQITINTSGLGMQAGQQLTCTGGPASGATLSYQWLSNGESLGSANGAQTSTYTVQAGDAEKLVQCRVLATNTAATAAAIQASAPLLTAENVVSPFPGTAPPTTTQTSLATPAVVGGGNLTEALKKLTCAAGTWTGSPTFAFQWYRNGVALSGNGANTSEYTVQAGDVTTPAVFQCAVTASNAGGKATLFSSNRNTANPIGAPSSPPSATATVPTISMVSTTTEGSGSEVCVASVDTCQAGESNALASSLAGIQGVAIDQATGNLYVISNSNRRVDVFSATGTFEGAFGWNVKASAPAEELQFCTLASGCKAGVGGAKAGQLENLENSQPAVDPTNGNLVLTDPGNSRIETFGLTLNGSKEVTAASFIRAVGNDVLPTINERQTTTLTNATGGTFKLSFKGEPTGAIGVGDTVSGSNEIVNFNTSTGTFVAGEEIFGAGIPAGTIVTAVSFDSLTISANATSSSAHTALTASLPYNASATTVQGVLRVLPSIGTPNVFVTGPAGGPWVVEFGGVGQFGEALGALRGFDEPQMVADASGLTGSSPTASVVTNQNGLFGAGTGFEQCTATTTCKAGNGSEGTAKELGQFNSNSTNLAVDSTGAVYTSGVRMVQRINPAGTAVEEFAPSQLTVPGVGSTSTARIAVAVDPSTDHVVVVKRISSTEAKFGEFTRTGTLIDETPVGESGVSIGSGTGARGFAFGTAGRAYFTGAAPKVLILGNPPSPSVTIDAPSGVGSTTATFNGTVTPSAAGIEGGFKTGYHFEYSPDGIVWTSLENLEAGDGTGAGSPSSCPTGNPPSCIVTQSATNLQPGRSYLVRLSAGNGTEVVSATKSFTTSAASPVIVRTVAEPVGETSAILTASINPNNRPTTYHFEWGTDGSYGTRIPADYDAVAGSGGEVVKVTANLTNLSPHTVYHYRVVASNSAGNVTGPDQEFITLNSEGLPDNRSLEMVSPANKGSVGLVGSIGLFPSGILAQPSESGSRFGYSILNGLENADAGGMVRYAANRTSSSWQTSQVSGPGEKSVVLGYSPELNCALVSSIEPITEDVPSADIQFETNNLYMWNASNRSYTLLTKVVPFNPQGYKEFEYVYVSPDCSRVYFYSDYDYFSKADGLYEWDNGTLRDAGLLPNGAIPSATLTAGKVVGPGAVNVTSSDKSTSLQYAMSEDGERFFFTAISNQGADSGKISVFVRKNHGGAVVDASQPTTATPTQGALYEAASRDGSHVYFRANYGLSATSSIGPTTGACASLSSHPENKPCDLYDYNVETGQLTDISATTDPTNTNGAVVEGLVDVSRTGSYVYFTAMGQLVPGKGKTYKQNLAGSGSVNMYVYHEGTLTFVANLDAAQDLNPFIGGIGDMTRQSNGDLIRTIDSWVARTTPNGKFLLFVSIKNQTGYEGGGTSVGYRYSAESNSVACVTCRPDGLPSLNQVTGNVVFDSGPFFGVQSNPSQGHYVPRAMSDNGQRIFFSSYDVLAPGALAGERNPNKSSRPNVYEWENGQIYLLDTPEKTGQVGVGEILGSSASGNDVYIGTRQQLLPEDFDHVSDVYDLRVNGGYPPAPVPPPACVPAEDQCQGTPTPQPAAPNQSTSSLVGPGNSSPPPTAKCPKGKVRRDGKCVAKHSHRKSKKRSHKRHQVRAANFNAGGAK